MQNNLIDYPAVVVSDSRVYSIEELKNIGETIENTKYEPKLVILDYPTMMLFGGRTYSDEELKDISKEMVHLCNSLKKKKEKRRVKFIK